MKGLFFQEKIKKYTKTSQKFTMERALFILFITTFSLMVIVQAAMTNPSVRTFMTADEEYSGTPMETEEFMYSEGSISLKLLERENDPDLRVLINGDEAAVFNDNVVNLSVKDGDVVELDGSSSFNEAVVEIVSKSDNISDECIGKSVKVKSNIKKVVDIKVK